MTTPLTQLGREERRAAKAQLVAGMLAGRSWREAAAAAGITTTEATAFRDHRHGYAYKLPPAVRHWLTAYCHDHPHTPSHALQTVLREQFDVLISVGYLNQVRAALALRYVPLPSGKKLESRSA